MTEQRAAPTGDVGHQPVVPPRIVRNVPRLPQDLVERFRAYSVPDLSDAVGPLYTFDLTIRPLYSPISRLVGRALTAKVPPGDNLTIHGGLGLVEADDVLVIDWRGFTGGCGSGAASLLGPIHRGLAGIVIDGCWRDLEEVQALGLPVFGRGVSPYSPSKARPGEINVPVCCGGVIVHAGDIIVADVEGIVVVPRQHAAAVADALDARRQRSKPRSPDGSSSRRWEQFEHVFRARGGAYVDWRGSDW